MSSVQFFTPSVKAPPSTALKVPAGRCAHCRRELPTGEGQAVEHVGVLGPECVRKYGPLTLALAQANGLEAHEGDQDSITLAHYAIWKLRGIGVDVAVVDVRAGVKALRVTGLSRRPAAVIKSWQMIRGEFEQRLRLAAAERNSTSPRADGGGA